MGVFKQFATNRKLEVEGLPVKFDPNPDGTVPTIYIKRVYRESPKYQAIFERVTKPYKYMIDSKEGIKDEALDAKLMQRIAAEACPTGWENMRLPEGVGGIGKGEGRAIEVVGVAKAETIDELLEDNKQFDIEYNLENVCALFAVLPDMWKKIAAMSGDSDAYKVGELEEMAKNS